MWNSHWQMIGAQGVLWAELVSALRLSKSTFGAVQLVSPLTGWVADQFSLEAALITVGFSGLAVIWLARRVK
jgi:hypothetical protein